MVQALRSHWSIWINSDARLNLGKLIEFLLYYYCIIILTIEQHGPVVRSVCVILKGLGSNPRFAFYFSNNVHADPTLPIVRCLSYASKSQPLDPDGSKSKGFNAQITMCHQESSSLDPKAGLGSLFGPNEIQFQHPLLFFCYQAHLAFWLFCFSFINFCSSLFIN